MAVEIYPPTSSRVSWKWLLAHKILVHRPVQWFVGCIHQVTHSTVVFINFSLSCISTGDSRTMKKGGPPSTRCWDSLGLAESILTGSGKNLKIQNSLDSMLRSLYSLAEPGSHTGQSRIARLSHKKRQRVWSHSHVELVLIGPGISGTGKWVSAAVC